MNTEPHPPTGHRLAALLSFIRIGFGVGCGLTAVSHASAQNICVTSGFWTNPPTWSDEVPASGQAVIVPAGYTVVLDQASAELGSFELAGTLVFSNWTTFLAATDLTIRAGGVMTLPAAFTTAQMSNRVHLVCSNFTLEAGAAIQAQGRGYANNFRSGGYGPGAGAAGEYGAGHGGQGLPISSLPFNGRPYDDPATPFMPGSSGGGSWTPQGGSGGGAVFIEAAGAVRVDGVINASGGNGGSSGGTSGGGGSGGSIYIRCATFQGASSGLLTVAGGGPAAEAPGAGGRIAIHYDQTQQALLPIPGVTFRARPGANALRADAMGSLYLTDGAWVTEPFLNFDSVWLHGDWASTWTCAGDFVPSNSIGFGPEFASVIVAGDVRLDGVALGLSAGSQLHCRNLILTNSASLSVFSAYVSLSAPTLSTPLYGALVSASNAILLATNTWIYPISLVRPFTGISNTNAIAPLFQAAYVQVASNAGFNADHVGHPTASSRTINSWGNGGGAGSGRGFGTYTGSYGGSHGGLGINAPASRLYGSRFVPVFPGSGGGGGWTGAGGAGGGAIRIHASAAVVLDGSLTADAGLCQGQGSGGAGGSILVLANTFLPGPNALLSARGGEGDSSKGGGGGRIAVGVGLSPDQVATLYTTDQLPAHVAFHNADSLPGRFRVAGGVNGAEGTAVWFFITRGSFLVLR